INEFTYNQGNIWLFKCSRPGDFPVYGDNGQWSQTKHLIQIFKPHFRSEIKVSNVDYYLIRIGAVHCRVVSSPSRGNDPTGKFPDSICGYWCGRITIASRHIDA
ncbi:hypothetical protein, partial [Yersinia alsatica]|uniref:hypothetical protein n=1 Tax=Yersinia alsatica TaxID=2890317 RepID=UPI001C9671A9